MCLTAACPALFSPVSIGTLFVFQTEMVLGFQSPSLPHLLTRVHCSRHGTELHQTKQSRTSLSTNPAVPQQYRPESTSNNNNLCAASLARVICFGSSAFCLTARLGHGKWITRMFWHDTVKRARKDHRFHSKHIIFEPSYWSLFFPSHRCSC